MKTNDDTVGPYGAAIALVSGLYSLASAAGGTRMLGTNSGILMAVLGAVVVLHGVVLLTPYAARLGGASGPLMIGYAVVMLLNQALLGTTGSMDWGMGTSGGMGGGAGMAGGMSAGPAWDLGMVALAVLMLVSGLLMTVRRPAGTSRM